MFARTPKAAEFRKWVLKVLGTVVDNTQPEKQVIVSEHTRALPSGKKEIVLSEKAKAEIGGIVKSCAAVAVREEIEAQTRLRAENVDLKNRLRQIQLWANGFQL